jgi:hypothetical protein
MTMVKKPVKKSPIKSIKDLKKVTKEVKKATTSKKGK